MKKVFLYLLVIICIIGVKDVKAATVNSADISPSTYVIGKYMYTRNVNDEAHYDGKLTTQRIMLASRTISGTDESGMIIYYKTATGKWIDALTGQNITVPTTFDVEVTDLNGVGTQTSLGDDYETFELDKDKIDNSTYVIGDYMYTRNKNAETGYDGKLTTQRIMLASRTISKTNEADMIIYYKTARGIWIDALTGQEVTPPQKFAISTVDLIYQKNNKKVFLLSGSDFNKRIKQLAGNANADYSTKDENITKIKRETNVNNIPSGVIGNSSNVVSTSDSYYPVYVWYKDGVIYYYSEGSNILLNSSSFSMFRDLSKVTEIDLSGFDTSNVTDIGSMFSGCSSLISLNLSGFDTSNVTKMSHMFSGCSSLTSLNLGNFNTGKVTDMSCMFLGCNNLTNLDLSTFDMSKVTSVSYMFDNLTSLKELKTPKVNSTKEISLGKSLYDSDGNEYTKIISTTPTKIILKTKTVMLSGIDFSKKIKRLAGNESAYYNTVDENITKIKKETNANNIPSGVIGNSNNVVSTSDSYYPVYVWYKDGVVYYYSEEEKIPLNKSSSSMFESLSNVIEIDLSGFDTSNVTSMSSMFSDCKSLRSIDLSNFDTSNVTSMSSMFSWCTSLTSIDLSVFDMSKVTSVSSMFYNLPSLKELKTPKISPTIDISIGKSLYDSNDNEYTKLTSTTPTEIILKTKAAMITGYQFNAKIKQLAGNANATYNTIDEHITKIKKETNANNIPSGVIGNSNNVVSTSDSYYPVYVWYKDGVIYYYTEDSYIVLNSSSYNMFSGLSNVTEINLSGFDMSKVTSVSSMFNNLTSLKELITPKINPTIEISIGKSLYDSDGNEYTKLSSTTPIETLLTVPERAIMLTGYQFNAKIKQLAGNNNASYLTTDENITKIKRETNVNNIPSGVIGNSNNVVSTSDSYYPVYAWYKNGVIYYYTEDNKVLLNKNSSSMFSDLLKVTEIDLSGFDTSNVTTMSSMFSNCSSLTSIDLSNFSTSKVNSMSYMFYECSGLTSLNLSGFNTTNVTSMNSMFSGCSRLTSLNLSNFNTSNVTNMTSMFGGCSSITSLNLSSFDTSKVTTMDGMFYECSKLTSLNLSNFNTSNVTTMSSMFSNCSSLTSLNLSSFDTSKVTDMMAMFGGCRSLTSLNLSNFNTSNVTNMAHMFISCEKLTSLNLSNFDTSKVTNMSCMFESCKSLTNLNVSSFNTSNVIDMARMFYYCEKLTSLNLSNFNTSKVTNMSKMFERCNSLTTLNVSSFNTSNVINMSLMFNYCEKLTSLNLSNFDTSNVTDMSEMFEYCRSLTNLNVSNFNTNKVTSMKSMFRACGSLTSLDLSSFYTGNVTDMSNMFSSCDSLTSLNIINFNTSKVTSMKSMFQGCSNLPFLNLYNFNTSNVTDMSYMFYDCRILSNLNVSSFNTSNVTNMSYMFGECYNLTSLNIINFNTSKVTSMESMFNGCINLTSLDLSSFDTSKVTNMNTMFGRCSKVTTAYARTSADASKFNSSSGKPTTFTFVVK